MPLETHDIQNPVSPCCLFTLAMYFATLHCEKHLSSIHVMWGSFLGLCAHSSFGQLSMLTEITKIYAVRKFVSAFTARFCFSEINHVLPLKLYTYVFHTSLL